MPISQALKKSDVVRDLNGADQQTFDALVEKINDRVTRKFDGGIVIVNVDASTPKEVRAALVLVFTQAGWDLSFHTMMSGKTWIEIK